MLGGAFTSVGQAEACYWLAGECLSEADDYLRKAAVVDQGLETIRITEEQLQKYHQVACILLLSLFCPTVVQQVHSPTICV